MGINGRLDLAEDGARKTEKKHVHQSLRSSKSYADSPGDSPKSVDAHDWDTKKVDRRSAGVDTAVASVFLASVVDVQPVTSESVLGSNSHCTLMVGVTCSIG